MRKYTLFTILLLCLAVRGQTITDLVDIDLSGLPQPTTAKALRYWFDDDAESQQTVRGLTGIYTLDVRSLTDGLHTLHFQVIEDNDAVGDLVSGLFMKFDSKTDAGNVKADRLFYWFDDDTAIQSMDISLGVQLLDASSLQDGLHTLHYQVLCDNGQTTSTYSSVFLRMNINTDITVAQSLRYWFDDDQAVTEVGISDGVQLLDASTLTDGLHTVHFQIIDNKGMAGTIMSSVFMKMDAEERTTAQSLHYWFDDDASSLKVVDVAKGTQTLDVSNLVTGLHTLCYQLIDSDGKVGSPVTRLFMKDFDKLVAEGENRITKYKYWLNDKSDNMQTVELNGVVNPYELITLLPVLKMPIRSKQFHFEVTDGQPTIYADNTLHIRFHDTIGYFVDDAKSFVDYSVNQVVEPAGEMQTTQTFERVSENDIRWYTVQLLPGDTVAFRVSQPAMLQLFSPNGEELFRTSEAASMQWDGTHVWKEGTYYLAVHDVTGSQSSMTLDYLHMDKYDVVEWDVHTVGDGGCSTITFKGNGFRDLYAVDLFNAAGDSIHSFYIGHESDAETGVGFNFTGAELGEYTAEFRFTGENKVFTNIVTVEEAVDIELATNVSFPSSFLRGTSTTYTIKITNKGNMTAYAVPIFTYIKSKTENGVYNIKYKGLDNVSLAEAIGLDNMSEEDILIIQQFSDSICDDWLFTKVMVEDEDNPGDSVVVRSNYAFVNVSPNSTKTLELSLFTSEDKVIAYFTTPESWLTLSGSSDQQNMNKIKRFYSDQQTNVYCCIKEGVECFADMLSFRYDVGSIVLSAISAVQPEFLPIAETVSWIDCGFSIGKGYLKAFGDWVCQADEEAVKDELRDKIIEIVQTTLSMSLSCISAKLNKLASAVTGEAAAIVGNVKVGEIMKSIVKNYFRLNPIGSILETIDCTVKLAKPKPGCPPTPPGGGPSSPVESLDPNDIYGYLSDAGNKFIADSVTRVNYTIEFENDTTFATAAAHTIVVKDTLDRRYFDLEKFVPTGVRIGSKEEHLSESDIYTNNGRTSFVKTIDMRPEIYAIAQVEGDYDHAQGIATWTFTSLDPMSMEPTDDLMQGILPVNWDGTSGIGEVMFEVGVKPNKGDGTEVKNRAGIVFDYEEPIITPTWVNTVDAVAPTSSIEGAIQAKTDTLTLRLKGEDNRSGIWRYNVYAQYGKGTSWELVKENVAVNSTEGETETLVDVRIYDGIDHGFCVLATDSAGNVERKEFTREFEFYSVPEYTQGDVNSDGKLDTQDAIKVIRYYLGKKPDNFDAEAADVNGDGNIDTQDAIQIIRRYLKK